MLLLDSYGIERRRAVFIGDTTHDAEVARTLGVSCVLLSTGHQSRARNRRNRGRCGEIGDAVD
jgi:phosphoglycolate phosphatase-like HAD superfamily hydrolase